jgi:hypothetical protein
MVVQEAGVFKLNTAARAFNMLTDEQLEELELLAVGKYVHEVTEHLEAAGDESYDYADCLAWLDHCAALVGAVPELQWIKAALLLSRDSRGAALVVKLLPIAIFTEDNGTLKYPGVSGRLADFARELPHLIEDCTKAATYPETSAARDRVLAAALAQLAAPFPTEGEAARARLIRWSLIAARHVGAKHGAAALLRLVDALL